MAARRRSAAASPRGIALRVMAALPSFNKAKPAAPSATVEPPKRTSGLLCTSITAATVAGCQAEMQEVSALGGPLVPPKQRRRRRH